MESDEITEIIIGAAIAVHKELGPGLLESAYQICTAHEIRSRGLYVECERAIPVVYQGLKLDCGYRVDMIVNGQVVVEVKAVAKLDAIFSAQLLTYLKLLNLRIGLLINFNVPILKSGVKRLVNGW